jgi:hypothetical protein
MGLYLVELDVEDDSIVEIEAIDCHWESLLDSPWGVCQQKDAGSAPFGHSASAMWLDHAR